MSELDDLPGQVASQVENAVQIERDNATQEMHEAELKLERERIKAEERIAERAAERDEHIADVTSDAERYKSMLDELFGRMESFFSSNTPQVSVDASHQIGELPAATEDLPSDAETDIENPEETADESIEELGGVENEVEQAVENPVGEIENATSRKRRKRRGGR